MKSLNFLFSLLTLVVFISCSNQEDSIYLGSKVYQLQSVADPGLLGKLIISENSDGSSTVILELYGTSTEIHPTLIYHNSLMQGGSLAITLEPCGCVKSITVVTALDNGKEISYDELINFNGHIKVHKSETEMETILLQGDIGSNVN
jgi:hypothetical protein